MKRLQKLLLAVAIILAVACIDRMVRIYSLESAVSNVRQVEATPFPPEVSMATIPFKNDYDSKSFRKEFIKTKPVEELRQANFGIGTSKKIMIFTHPGGQKMDIKLLEATVRAVIQRMPNLKTTNPLVALAMETMAAETGCGAEKAYEGVSKWNNYGPCQFRVDTAEETLAWLKTVRPDVYHQVMSLVDTNKSMAENLLHNVPFSIAMMLQYYWRRVPDLQPNITTKEARAEMWKSEYNTPKGLGTVQNYLDRLVALK